MMPSHLGCQAEKIAIDTTPAASPSVMPDALPAATLQIYLGLEPAWGSADFCPVTFGYPWLGYNSTTIFILIKKNIFDLINVPYI